MGSYWITFKKDIIIKEQNDINCPKFYIYCILKYLIQFYIWNEWKNCFKKGWRPLKCEDAITITLRNGEMRYVINDVDLVNFIKIDTANKKEIYLLINIRNCKCKTQIIYILWNF